jgi:transmembrane sensor
MDWLVELDDDALSIQERDEQAKAFARWFSQSELHQDAFIEAQVTSGIARRMEPGRRIEVSRLIPPGVRMSAAPVRRAGPRIPWIVCASVLLLLLAPLLIQALNVSPVTYRAGTGERIFVPLEDGSSVELNTRSRIEVDLTAHLRRVTLLSGEALFEIQHDAARPFRIVVGGTVIEDIGTKFSVYRHPSGSITVSVLEGEIELSTTIAGSSGPYPLEVSAGHQVLIIAAQGLATTRISAVSREEMNRSLGWRQGRIYFQGETLAEAIAEFNRYNRPQLRIADPKLADLTIGGGFVATDPASFLSTLDRVYGAKGETSADGRDVIALRRSASVN